MNWNLASGPTIVDEPPRPDQRTGSAATEESPRVGGDAHRRLHHVRDRQSAAALRRAVLHRGQAHHRHRHRRLRRDLRRHVRAAHGGGDGRRRRRSAGDRRRPEPHRVAVAADVLLGLRAAARPDAGRRDERHRDGVLGHRRQGRRQAGRTTCSAVGCTNGSAPTPTCIRPRDGPTCTPIRHRQPSRRRSRSSVASRR